MCQLYLKQDCDLARTLRNMLIKLIKSVKFKEAHIENDFAFNWKFCSQVVADLRCES